MSSEIKKTISHASIYAVGIILSRVISFIMLPIYTNFLTPQDYGVLELLMMTSDVVSFLVGIGIANGIFRFYYKYEEQEDRNAVISTAFLLVMALYGSAVLICILNSDWFSVLLFQDTSYSDALKYIFGALFFHITSVIAMSYVRAMQKPVQFIIINIIKLVIQLSLNIYFIVYLRLGVMGAVYSDFISAIILGIALILFSFKKTGLYFHKTKASELIRYGAPFILTNIGAFILTFSDRYFIKHFWGLDEVGVYSLGYKIGFLLTVLVSRPIKSVWEAQQFEVIKKPNRMEIINKTLFLYSFAIITVGMGLSLFSKDLFRAMSAFEFWNAYKVVPFVVLAYIFQGLTGFFSLGILYKQKTIYISVATIVAVLVILAFSFILIPPYGGIGAAIATLIAFFVRMALVYYFAQKLYYLEYKTGRPMAILLLAVIISSVNYLVLNYVPYFDNVFLSIITGALFVIIYFALTLALKIIPDKNRNELIDFILDNKIVNKIKIFSFIVHFKINENKIVKT